MSTHTPGPWTYSKGNYSPSWREDIYLIETKDKRPSGNNLGDGYQINIAHMATEANARLIAAAPRMLECIQNVEANLSGPDHFVERVADSLRRCRAVLREIEGEEAHAKPK